MELKITVRNKIPFPKLTEEYLDKKIGYLEEHFSLKTPFPVEAIFFEERHLKVCELILKARGKDFFARAEEADFNKAIDEACHKLKAQMEKQFKKMIDEKRRAQ